MSKLRNRSSAATTTPIHKEISERGLLLPTEPDFKGNFQVASAAAALTITMRSVVVIIIIMLKWREKWEHVHDNLEMGRRKEGERRSSFSSNGEENRICGKADSDGKERESQIGEFD